MKKLFTLTLLVVFSCISATAQKVLIGSNFNEVANDLNLTIQSKGMTEKKSEMKDGIMAIYYIPKIVTGKEQSLKVFYTISEEGIIKKVEVEGTFAEVANLFTGYWKTKAAYNTQRGAISEKRFVSDVVRFHRDSKNNSAYITVSGS